MSNICFITKKKTTFGNNVSHSNRKTKRKFLPNIQKLKIWVPKLNKFIRFKITKKGLKFINKFGIDSIITNFKKGYKYNYIWQRKQKI